MNQGQQAVQDAFFVARAIDLAKRGLYTTRQNPRVGCVIVKDGKIIGEGWHRVAGEAHAEINAINAISSGNSAADATVYVTLEPCCHQGKTGPCTDALIKAGVKKVVCAMEDPAPQVSGKGFDKLRQAGIEVQNGLLSAQAAQLNPGFIKRMTTGLPWVRIKMAMSVDGRTAASSGESKWITGDAARQDVQQWRAQSCVILSGIETVLQDDPMMTVRPDASWENRWPEDVAVKQPLRCVLDSRLRFPLQATLLKQEGAVLIVSSSDNQQKKTQLEQAGVQVWSLEANAQGKPDLKNVLKALAKMEINEVWVESGSHLAGAFVAENLFDELVIYMAPSLLGSSAKALFDLPALQHMQDKIDLRLLDTRRFGEDLRFIFGGKN